MAENRQPPSRPQAEKPGTDDAFGRHIGPKERRKLRARREGSRSVWFWLGMMGLVGWSVAVPTVIGVAIGAWVDATWPGQVSWTLTGMIVGVIVGCLNAWYWVKRESERKL